MAEADDAYAASLRGADLVLPDRSLRGSLYADSELWAYVRSEARDRKHTVPAYALMFSPYGEFDEDLARDVMAAVVSTRGAATDRGLAESAHEMTPAHMLLFLRLV